MKQNRFLRDRMIGRDMARGGGQGRSSNRGNDNEMDGRNPYGSRGGYVTTDRQSDSLPMHPQMQMEDYAKGYRDAMKDFAMDGANLGQVTRMYTRGMDGARGQGNRGGNQGGSRGGRDNNEEDYGDYGDYASMDEEFKEELETWCKKLKKKDRFKLTKEDIIKKAKQMGVKFDEYDELEFITVFYMLQSDYPSIFDNEHGYIAMAKQWLEDDDIEVSPSEKLAIYYYKIVKGE